MQVVAGVVDPGYSCNMKLAMNIETPRHSEAATTTLNMHLIANRDRRSRLRLFSRVSQGAQRSRPTFRARP